MNTKFGNYPSTSYELYDCFLVWKKNHKTGMRFGQWLINNYALPGVTWPEVFYEQNELVVYNMVVQFMLEELSNNFYIVVQSILEKLSNNS